MRFLSTLMLLSVCAFGVYANEEVSTSCETSSEACEVASADACEVNAEDGNSCSTEN